MLLSILLFIYLEVPKSAQYYHSNEGERNVYLYNPYYFHHIHPLLTLDDKTHVHQSI